MSTNCSARAGASCSGPGVHRAHPKRASLRLSSSCQASVSSRSAVVSRSVRRKCGGAECANRSDLDDGSWHRGSLVARPRGLVAGESAGGHDREPPSGPMTPSVTTRGGIRGSGRSARCSVRVARPSAAPKGSMETVTLHTRERRKRGADAGRAHCAGGNRRRTDRDDRRG